MEKEDAQPIPPETVVSKSKKKRNKKKKKAAAGGGQPGGQTVTTPGGKALSPSNLDPSMANKDTTAPETGWALPSFTVSSLFSKGDFPAGEEQPYIGDNIYRSTSAEKRELEKMSEATYQSIRRAAEVHRRVRQDAQTWVKPGMKLIDVCRRIEANNRHLVEAKGLEAGIAFPTGCSVNRCAAHYTPNTGDNTVIADDDVVKFDFGTHVNGYIIDCAWTQYWNPKYKPLVEAVRDATNTGIKEAGIDVRLCDIGAAIQEVMESYEIELDGETHQIKSIGNLTGHSIEPYVIHAGKSVPIVKGGEGARMEEGEFYAIETFGSTGKGRVVEEGECSHYMLVKDAPFASIRNQGTRKLYSYLNQKYGTLAFCRRWLDEDGQTGHIGALRQLVQAGLCTQHPPLIDVRGSYTAQFEHTIMLRPTCKEVISRGDDF
eukprot:TRINITY_DN16701_c0_g1_i1.p1 TRINITY_DN16701_c0_g1~~TRINITY_DN16701_c0_g1_i1.p1  ORF type:complete len:431 (-),score=107.90 TRINITY_DN16701_c0_g1_i1:42-1334(-)